MSDRQQGVGLGNAYGTITVEARLQQAEAEVRRLNAVVEQQFGQIDAATRRTEARMQQFGAAMRTVGAALGVNFGAQMVQDIGRAVIAADKLATAYSRQEVAALSLAGSQAKLNELLDAYDEATGGAISNAQAMADVTRLQAIGFADSAEELERFAIAARGAAIAMGQSQEYIITQMQLAIANQSTMRLDQLGLGVQEVKQRIDELRSSNRSMTEEMAYQEAVLGLLDEKFGDVATSTAGMATGVERVEKAWADLRLEFGQDLHIALDPALLALADLINAFNEARDAKRAFENELNDLGIERARELMREQEEQPFSILTSRERAWIEEADTRTTARRRRGTEGGDGISEVEQAQQERTLEWYQDRADLAEKTEQQILDAATQYGEQRASTIRNFEQSMARSAEDFARQRLRAEEDFARQVADVHEAAARREMQLAEQRARSIAQAQEAAASRIADLTENYERSRGERRLAFAEKVAVVEEERLQELAETRADAAARLLEIDEEYAEQRVRAAEEHAFDVASAAARMDARAIFALQRRRALEEEEAEQAYADERANVESRLDEELRTIEEASAERLAKEQAAFDKANRQAEEAYNRQVKNEQEALAERIADAEAAYAQQLEAGRIADAQRLQDMNDAFELQKRRADQDHQTQMDRQIADHNAQLLEQDRQHGLRMTQIQTQAGKEREALDKKFAADMVELGEYIKGWEGEMDSVMGDALEAAIKFFDDLEEHLEKRQPSIGTPQGPQPDLAGMTDAELQAGITNANSNASLYGFGTDESIYWSMLAWQYQVELNRRAKGGTAGMAEVSVAGLGGAGMAGSTITIQQGAVTVYGAAGQPVEEIGGAVETALWNIIQRATGAYAR